MYAGIIGASSFSVESPDVSFAAPIRLGAGLKWRPKGIFFMNSFATYDVGSGVFIGRFSVGVSKKWFQIEAGYMPTVSTLYHRPYPVSGFGQFEPYTKRIVPGGSIGALVSVAPPRSPVSIDGSFHVRNGQFDYQLGFQLIRNRLRISAWALNDSLGGGAISYYGDKWLSTLTVRPDNIALFGNVEVYKNFFLYCDVGLNSWLGKDSGGKSQVNLVRGEGGILKAFSYKFISGLVGIGYAHESKSVNGYLFIHL